LLAAIQFLKERIGGGDQVRIFWEIVRLGLSAAKQGSDDFVALRLRQRLDLGNELLNNRCHDTRGRGASVGGGRRVQPRVSPPFSDSSVVIQLSPWPEAPRSRTEEIR
jgi:hypothetical protein